MAEDSNAPAPQQRQFDSARPGRGPQREPGGFRIRLSDNEMRAVRAVQDAFQLRSPVAALGFSVRSLAQLLEEGKLEELVAQQRQQAGSRPGRGEAGRGDGGRGEGGRGDGQRRSGRPFSDGRPERGPRIDPLARPPRPTAVAVTEIAVSEAAPGEESETVATEAGATEAGATEVGATEASATETGATEEGVAQAGGAESSSEIVAPAEATAAPELDAAG